MWNIAMKKFHWIWFNIKCKSVLCCGHCCSVAKLCPTLCDPMECNTSGFPVPYHLLKFVPTHIHWVGDAIQPSHTLSSPSPPTFNLSQHQGLFIGTSAFSIIPSNEYSGLISFRVDWLDLLAVQESSQDNTTVQNHQFFSAQLSL